MIQQLIADTRGFIAQHLAEMSKPAVACSFGKDSMVMLWLVREQKLDVDVVYFENMPHPTKHKFAHDMALRLGINLITPQASYRDVIGGEKTEIVELYQVGAKNLIYSPIFAHPLYKVDNQASCAVDKLNDPVCHSSSLIFDGILLGHKDTDVDSLGNPIPLQNNVYKAENGFRYLYPLKNWTEADIWEATRLLNIPQNWRRYQRGDLSTNNDYYSLCTRCLSSDVPVLCPKTQSLIPGVGAQLKLDANRAAWRSTFINLA